MSSFFVCGLRCGEDARRLWGDGGGDERRERGDRKETGRERVGGGGGSGGGEAYMRWEDETGQDARAVGPIVRGEWRTEVHR